MANVFDYLAWRGDLPFTVSPVNEVDIVVLSQIVLLDLNKSVPTEGFATVKECYKNFSKHGKRKKLGAIIPEQIKDLFSVMAKSVRFSDVKLSRYAEDIDESTETQFSALVADAEDINTRFIVFSGTDDTIVGWKENFNLIFKTPTNAQLESVKYLEAAAEGFDGTIYVLGHSKGGHLALYSTAYCSEKVQKKIEQAYSLDGPGLPEGEESKEKLRKAKNKIISILPQGSVIGRLFEHEEKFKIIHSTEVGLFQHDTFSWEVLGTKLVETEDFTENASGVDHGMRAILSGMSDDERRIFVEGLFKMFTDASCKTLTDVTENFRDVARAYFKTTGETKKVLNRTFVKIFGDKYMRWLVLNTSKNLKKHSAKPDKKKIAAVTDAAKKAKLPDGAEKKTK